MNLKKLRITALDICALHLFSRIILQNIQKLFLHTFCMIYSLKSPKNWNTWQSLHWCTTKKTFDCACIIMYVTMHQTIPKKITNKTLYYVFTWNTVTDKHLKLCIALYLFRYILLIFPPTNIQLILPRLLKPNIGLKLSKTLSI